MKTKVLVFSFILPGLVFAGLLFTPKEALAGKAADLLKGESNYVKKGCEKYKDSSESKMKSCIKQLRAAEHNQKNLAAENAFIQERCKKYLKDSKGKLEACIKKEKRRLRSKEGEITLGKQPNIRVGIAGTKGTVKITASGEFYIRDKSNKTLKTLKKGAVVSVSMSGSKYVVKGSGVNLKMSDYPRFVSKGAIMDVREPKEYYHRFKNTIEVRKGRDGKLWVINEVPLENYLAGLGELGNSGPEEYVKALGVAARTYAYYWASKGGRHPDQNCDIYDTTADQLYYGYDYEQKIPRVAKIFRSTGGQMVTYKGKPIAAVYSSSAGGKTKTGPHPYLKSVDDPYGGKTRIGHGMGLSAKGAVGYAEHGKNYKWILEHYYKGTKVQKIY